MAHRGRVYGLTTSGKELRRELSAACVYQEPPVDWALYGWISFRQRAAVLRVLDEPLQPATIKRRARYRDPSLRMSANNARDVIYEFLERGIVETVCVRGKAHTHYQLTTTGRALQDALARAETPWA